MNKGERWINQTLKQFSWWLAAELTSLEYPNAVITPSPDYLEQNFWLAANLMLLDYKAV